MGDNESALSEDGVRLGLALAFGVLSVALVHPAIVYLPLPMVEMTAYMPVVGLSVSGLLLGPRWGAVSGFLYLLALLVGIPPRPVAQTGVELLAGPSGGYTLTEALMPSLVGFLVYSGSKNRALSSVSLARQLPAVFGVQFATILFGTLWISITAGRSFGSELVAISGNWGGVLFPVVLAMLVANVLSRQFSVTDVTGSTTAPPTSGAEQSSRDDRGRGTEDTGATESSAAGRTDTGQSRAAREESTTTASASPEEAVTTATAGPPTTIIDAPSVSVSYDALTKEEQLGAGGNADVFRATVDDGRESTVALKEPRMQGTIQADTVEAILSEAETWHKIDDHDHVVNVLDWGASPLPWVALEYMDDGHLGDRLGDIEFPEALWIARCLTGAVRHAHRHGIVHLDLKPENVLFRRTDAWSVPKVGDWGLSKQLLDHSGTVEGLSPQYAAPEQFDESYGRPDDITDIYQLGALCYALFTGRPPHQGTPASVMNATLNDSIDRPSAVADVPEALDEVLLSALETEKAERYDSTVYLRDAFDDLWEQHGP